MDNIEQRQPKIKKSRVFLMIFLLFVSVVLNAVMAWGVLEAQTKVRNIDMGKINATGQICKVDIIDKVNKLAEEKDLNKSASTLVSDIKARDNYTKDPNCIYSLYATALLKGDSGLQKESFSILTKMIENNNNPSWKFNFINSYSNMKELNE